MAQRTQSVGRVGAPFAVGKFGRNGLLEALAVGFRALANASDDRGDFVRQPAMARLVFGASAIEVEMEFDRRRTPAMNRAFDHRRTARVIRPTDRNADGVANGGYCREIR